MKLKHYLSCYSGGRDSWSSEKIQAPFLEEQRLFHSLDGNLGSVIWCLTCMCKILGSGWILGSKWSLERSGELLPDGVDKTQPDGPMVLFRMCPFHMILNP